MYKDIGKKIMLLAVAFGWIIGIASGIAACYFFYEYDILLGVITLVTAIVSILMTWPLYGFGQLVDDVHAMRHAPKQETAPVQSDELPEL